MVGIGKVNSPIVPCTREKFYEAVQSKFVQDTCDMIKRLQKKAKEEPARAEWAKKCIAQAKRFELLENLYAQKNIQKHSLKHVRCSKRSAVREIHSLDCVHQKRRTGSQQSKFLL